VAEIVGAELGWDPRRQSREVAIFLTAARREYDVPGAPEAAPVATAWSPEAFAGASLA
jgi:hypothetical protein